MPADGRRKESEMGKLADRAVSNHQSFYSCSGAVLCAFHEAAGLSESEAQRKAVPFASGRAGKCGAVMSAEYVLKQVYGKNADSKISNLPKYLSNFPYFTGFTAHSLVK